ncbi:MAG TPA: hypothetical protein DCF70_03775 [Treponema sp.]|nr:hypothetical protein [Treponema sp.]
MILLVSCDNFLNGLDAKNQLEDGISYANARSIEVLVNAAEGTGTTVPSGQYTAKSGYPFEVSFTESADYAFAGWKAVFESDGTEASEGIHFDDPSALKTNVIISTEGIKVVPQCIRRIYIDGEPLPKYEATGVSRDRSITVNFSEPPAADSFLFTEDEIPAGALPEADDSGIWAYRLNGLTYFKNIEITGADEISLAAHFKKPEVDGNLLTIAVDKSNPIEIDTGSSFKIIKVTISDKIKASNGITINSGKTWRYQVTNETDEKATVTLSSEVAEGSVYLAGTRDYSIGQKLTLAFTESADYQFIRWDYDSSVVHVAEPLSASTTALIMEKSTGTQIKAVCAPRLRVLSFTPQNDVLSPTVSKNSSIVITFSQNLPSDEGMLNNISIAVGGSPVKNSFSSPRVNGNIITFSADKTNMLDVYAGQTKTVTVTVPADFYYETEEGYKVTYGGNGISFDYKIDNSTIEKAEIIFSSVQGSGTITPESGNVKHYSIGEEVAISFLVSDGWQFNGWKVTGADESVLSKIKIADENLPSTKLTILEAVTGVTVSADVSECLRVITKSPSSESNYKDSDIILTFNKSLDSECSSMLNKIRISSDGNNLDGCYTDRILSADGKTITVKSTAVLSVPKNSEKTISVFIPSDFFYKNANGLKIYHEEESFSFKVNHTTKEKAKITYSVINGETETPFSPAGAAGTINRVSYEEYNLGEEVDLSFDINPGYQFYGWKIVDSDDNAVTNDIISFKNSISTDSNSTLAFNKACNGITVYAVCYKRPSISTSDVSPYSSNSAEEFAKNKPVTLNFAHVIEEDTEQYIEIKYSVSSFSQSTYFSRTLSADKKTVTFTPIKMLPVENAFETVTVTVPHDKVYYLASDGKTKITIGDEDLSWSYKVNNSTVTKTFVRMDATDASGSVIRVNGDDYSTGDKPELNEEESFNLEYLVPEGYKFGGWKIACANSSLTVTNTSYLTSGQISVYDEDDEITYCTLKIDSSNPAKAVLTSYLAVEKGSAGWGVSVSAKDMVMPAVTSVTPGNGIQKTDIPIKLTFNMAMDASKLVYASDKISITNGAKSMKDFFEAPVLSENRKELTLTPKGVALRDYIASLNAASINLTVSLKTGITVTKDGVSIPLLQNDNSYFTVSYKPEFETTPPTKISFFATRKEISLQNATNLSSSDKFVLKQVDSMTNAEILQNRTKGTVYLYGTYSDGDSGVSTVTVTQRRTNTKTKGTPDVSELTTTVFTKNSTGVEFETGSGGITTFCIPYEITEEDGAILLTVTVADAVGNKAVTTETFSAIKRSIFYMGEYYGEDCSPYKLYNKCLGISSSVDGDKEKQVTSSEYKNGINDFIISFREDKPAIYGVHFGSYNPVVLGPENLTVQMKYTDKNGNTKIGKFTDNGVTDEKHLVLDVDGYLYGRTMELIITDDMGNVGRRTYTFPSESDLSVYLDSDRIKLDCKASYQGTSFYIEDFIRSSFSWATSYQPIYLTNQPYNLSVLMVYYKAEYDDGNQDYLYLGKTSSLSVKYSDLSNATFPTVTLPYTKYSLSKGKTNEINVTLYIDSSSWNSCDKIYVLNSDDIVSDYSQSAFYFTKNTTSLTIPCNVEQLHKYDHSFTIYGEKNNLRSSYVTIAVPKVTLNTYDTVQPTIMFGMDNSELGSGSTYTSDVQGADYKGETFKVYIKDTWSGPKTGTLTLSDGTTYTLNSSNYYKVDIPVWKLLNEYDTFYCKYVIYDNNNNKAEGIWAPQIKSCFNCSGTTLTIPNNITGSNYFYIGQYDDSLGKWTKYGSFTSNSTHTKTLPSSKFIKATGFYAYSYPGSTFYGYIFKSSFYYTGTASSGNYDYIIQNKDDSILVASDAPVYVQTLVTNRPYEECSTWSAEEWECFHKHVGDKYMAFSSSDHSPQKYTIPVSEIESGECYCVVVHFADNTTTMSEVKQK